MNPFLMYLMNLIQSSGFSNANNPYLQMQGQADPFGGSAFDPNPFLGGGMGGGAFTRLPFSPFPLGGRFGQQGIGRNIGAMGGAMGNPFGLRPTNDPPVDIPAPQPRFAPTNEGPWDIPAPGPVLQPFPQPPVPIPAPFETPPYIPPREPSMGTPFTIEPLPGFKVPVINPLTGLPGMQQGTMPARSNNPNAMGLPVPPRGFGGRPLYNR